ncbi:MAG: AlpA family phage regulatory protein [Gammaproteobacteria bacterium]|nr:AlpA family phage regulatory protein [Gammaproteobacteria bacterium]
MMQHNQILRKPQVIKMTGLSDSSIWRREHEGEFPKRRRLGLRAVGWYYDEVVAWIERREVSMPDL